MRMSFKEISLSTLKVSLVPFNATDQADWRGRLDDIINRNVRKDLNADQKNRIINFYFEGNAIQY